MLPDEAAAVQQRAQPVVVEVAEPMPHLLEILHVSRERDGCGSGGGESVAAVVGQRSASSSDGACERRHSELSAAAATFAEHAERVAGDGLVRGGADL